MILVLQSTQDRLFELPIRNLHVMHPQQSVRLHSLDAFRGIVIASMILVNTASLTPSVHPWLAHSYWNGCTLADWVFPFFLFIVGVAMAFSLSKYNQERQPTRALYWRLLRRGVFLFVLGLLLNGFWAYEWGTFGITGVLQRISLGYLTTASIVLKLPRKAQWGITALLLIGYWAAYAVFPVPEPQSVAEGLNRGEVGTFGIMSWFGMMNTIAIVLMGYFTGAWLSAEAVTKELRTSRQSMTLVLFGLSSIGLGQLWSLWLPINKKLWTSSYVLFTVGLALILLAACYELIEVRNQRRWSHPVQVLGLNSIFVYVSSELVIKLLDKTHVGVRSDAPSTYNWLGVHLFLGWSDATTAGFLFALVTLFFWWLVAYFLYRRHWSIAI
jgi:predicted acyltransferase